MQWVVIILQKKLLMEFHYIHKITKMSFIEYLEIPQKSIYVNGELITEEESQLPLPSDFSAINVLGDLNAVDGMEGALDDFAFFASALTPELVLDAMTGEMFGTSSSTELISVQPHDSSGQQLQSGEFTLELSHPENSTLIWFYKGNRKPIKL